MSHRQRSLRSSGNILTWWYEQTTPEPPAANASFVERDKARRADIASTIILMTVLIMIFFLMPPAVIQISSTGQPLLLIIATSMLVICAILVLLNRRGWTSVVGLILILGNTVGNCILLTSSGVFHVSDIQLLDTLVISLLFAVALLPTWFVFVNAPANVLIAAAMVYFFPHDVALNNMTVFFTLILRSSVIQIGVAVIAYLLVLVMQQAIERANNAEELAELERAIAEQKQTEVEQKQKLDDAIQDIIHTHVQVANGNYYARASFNRDNVLWSVAGNLNNLLSRMQQWRRESYERQRMSTAISHVIKKVLEARQQGVPLQFNLTGTELDALLIELNYIQREQHTQHITYARSTTQQNTDPLRKEIKIDNLRRVIDWQER